MKTINLIVFFLLLAVTSVASAQGMDLLVVDAKCVRLVNAPAAVTKVKFNTTGKSWATRLPSECYGPKWVNGTAVVKVRIFGKNGRKLGTFQKTVTKPFSTPKIESIDALKKRLGLCETERDSCKSAGTPKAKAKSKTKAKSKKKPVVPVWKKALKAYATKTYVDGELNKKADKTAVNSALEKKADKTYVDGELNKKADKSDLDTVGNATVNNTNRINTIERDVTALKQAVAKKSSGFGVDANIYPLVQGFFGPAGNFHLESILVGPRFKLTEEVQLRLAVGVGTDFKSNPSFITEGAVRIFPTAGMLGFEIAYGYTAYAVSSKTYAAMNGQSHILSARAIVRVSSSTELFLGAGGGIRTMDHGNGYTGGFVLSGGVSFNLPW